MSELFSGLPLQRASTAPVGWRPRNWPWGKLQPNSYDVCVIDIPWKFDLYSEAGEAKAPQAQYECMSLDEIKALPVKALLRPSALVFLWACWPMLSQALEVIEALGLVYVTGGSWAKRTRTGKLNVGTGYVIRTSSEPWLVTIDEAAAPFLVARSGRSFRNPTLRNHIDGLMRGHSRKPDEFYAALAAATPGRRRCDLFSGGHQHEGFEGWGHDHKENRDWEGKV